MQGVEVDEYYANKIGSTMRNRIETMIKHPHTTKNVDLLPQDNMY